MITQDPRRLALWILNELEKRRFTLDQLVGERFEQMAPGMSRRDRALAFAIIFGVLRWRAKLDWHIEALSSRSLPKIRPDILNILRIGLFQMLFFSRIPDSAAVNTSVEIAKKHASGKTAGFVNGLLRNAARQKHLLTDPDTAKDPLGALAVSQSYPVWLIRRWYKRFGAEETRRLCMYVNQVPPLTLRTNTLKITRDALIEKLENAGAAEKITPTKYSPAGLCLHGSRLQVFEMPGFTEGQFQVQDEAAQIAALVLDCRPGEHILDACAGLGGKTGHISQLMENRGMLEAMDCDSGKLDTLSLEMKRLGAGIVKTRVYDLNAPPDPCVFGRFDRIIVDAPCSGLGVIRRNPDLKWSAREKVLRGHAKKQELFLRHAAGLLHLSAGILVFAVCSMEPEETQGVITAFLKNMPGFEIQPVNETFPEFSDLTDQRGCVSIMPHRHGMDGFFIARLKRRCL